MENQRKASGTGTSEALIGLAALVIAWFVVIFVSGVVWVLMRGTFTAGVILAERIAERVGLSW